MLLEVDLRARLEALRESPGYRNYERAREAVLRMKEREPVAGVGSDTPSDYWREELANIEYLLDASPLVVEKLRQHSYHVTGIWAYNYRTHKTREQERHAGKLAALRGIGRPELFVPESPELGGFGFDLDGDLVNIDTLKFFEVVLALDKGAVLEDLRRGDERGVVWEIGAGWGGFAYQLKTLCPNVTYVISDLPELFLFSATYLMTLFPDARVAFWGDPDEPWDELDWLQTDFVFVPNFALEDVAPPRIDLAVNMVSFQEMTTEQVEGYVRHASERGAPFLYSLNRERSLYNPELEGVKRIIERYYWPNEIEMLPVSYGKFLDDYSGKAKRREGGEELEYKHVVGWRRVVP
jgi:putative sugar O-methyltransferase